MPQTVTPGRVAAATSIEALDAPVVTSSRRSGSRASSSASNGVRSRIATTTSASREHVDQRVAEQVLVHVGHLAAELVPRREP